MVGGTSFLLFPVRIARPVFLTVLVGLYYDRLSNSVFFR
jgi:hypothetical protein